MVAKIHDIPDVQGSNDTREIAIHRVGIKDIRHPVTILDRRGEPLSTVANLCMTVRLPEHYKGTHMSRFVEILNERERILSVESFQLLLEEMTQRLGAEAGHIDVTFPFFLRKTAPVTGVQSMLDYTVSFIGELGKPTSSFSMVVVIPVTSLCPCSKEISDYGAHNQRAHVTVKAYTQGTLWIEDLIEIVETQASSELYSLLKRPDEKYVTEQAYDNPKFVEDMIRDVAVELNRESRIRAYTLEVENFEAIHNHSAYAMIQVDKDGTAQRRARLG